MPSKERVAASELYANLMSEIKHRISAIDAGVTNRLPIPAPFVREFCFLQIRMICELIALGCLVAHGDISATQKKSMQKEWSAESIINALAALHSDFFPLAFKQGPGIEPIKGVNFIHPPIMTKEELLTLYGRCGGVLHKGSVKKLIKEQIPTQINFPEITAIAQKLNDLLSTHVVVMLGGKTVFLCVLRNLDNNGNVQVAIAEAGDKPLAQ